MYRLETAELLFSLNTKFPFCSQLYLKTETYSSYKLSISTIFSNPQETLYA